MTTAIETQTAQPLPIPRKAPVPVSDRGIVIADLEGLWRFAGYVAASGLAPKGIDKQESIFVAIQMGMEVGLTPMAALQNIAVINGRPSLWGDSMLALVRGSGLVEAYDETETNDEIDPLFRELVFTESTQDRRNLKIDIAKKQARAKRDTDDFGVTAFTKRQASNEMFGRFTVADAKKASLWGKSGPWSQYPARMLKFRARSFLLRDVYGDVLKGLHSAEENRDLPVEVTAGRVQLPSFTLPPVKEVQKAISETSAVHAPQTTDNKPADTIPAPTDGITPQMECAHVLESVGFDDAMSFLKHSYPDLETDSIADWTMVPTDVCQKLLADPKLLAKCVKTYGRAKQ